MKCYECENLIEYPIKVVDIPSKVFVYDERYHFENGFKCTWNGVESLDINDLSKKNCRCDAE